MVITQFVINILLKLSPLQKVLSIYAQKSQMVPCRTAGHIIMHLLYISVFIFVSDIDECERSGDMGGCQYFCVNTVGSYNCECPAGFLLTDDERTCRGIIIDKFKLCSSYSCCIHA